jgi:iron complex transport system substrate-binding protein
MADGVPEVLRALSSSIRIIDPSGGVSPDILVVSDDRRGKEVSGVDVAIPVFVYAPRNFLELADAFMALGVLTGEESGGIKLAAQTSSAPKHIRTIIGRLPSSSFPRVFIQEEENPLVTCGSSSFVSALIAEAGGKNIFQEIGDYKITVGRGEVVRRVPDIIIIAQGAKSQSRNGESSKSIYWSDTPAGESGKVYSIDLSAGLAPGTKSVTLLAKVAKMLHPDLIP